MFKPTYTPTIDSFPCLHVMFFHLLAGRLHPPLPRSRPSPSPMQLNEFLPFNIAEVAPRIPEMQTSQSAQWHLVSTISYFRPRRLYDDNSRRAKTTGPPTTRSSRRPSTFIIVWLGGRERQPRQIPSSHVLRCHSRRFHFTQSCHCLPLPSPYPSAWSLECTGCPIIILSRGAVSGLEQIRWSHEPRMTWWNIFVLGGWWGHSSPSLTLLIMVSYIPNPIELQHNSSLLIDFMQFRRETVSWSTGTGGRLCCRMKVSVCNIIY